MEYILVILLVVTFAVVLIKRAIKSQKKRDTVDKVATAIWIVFGVLIILAGVIFIGISYSLSHAKSMSQEEWDQLDSAYMALHPDTTITDTTSVTSTTSDVETLEVRIK